MSLQNLLTIDQLSIAFSSDTTKGYAVDNVSFTIKRNEILGVVGESGSGKSITSLAIMGLLPKSALIQGEICFDGTKLSQLNKKQLRDIRGRRYCNDFSRTYEFVKSINALW
ncbi:ATP-binding cassette domain-containing protein [Tritonibacter mobilis]|nr:ATP-binding cassette domain-containing protein [Tritonibacter mobilis]